MTKKSLFRITLSVCTVILFSSLSLAQNKTITGIVSDQGNNPLSGATVSVKGGQSITTKQDLIRI